MAFRNKSGEMTGISSQTAGEHGFPSSGQGADAPAADAAGARSAQRRAEKDRGSVVDGAAKRHQQGNANARSICPDGSDQAQLWRSIFLGC